MATNTRDTTAARRAPDNVTLTTNLDEVGFDEAGKARVEAAVKQAVMIINEAVQRGAAASVSAQRIQVKNVSTTVNLSTTQPTTSGGSGSVTAGASVTISFGK
jgi:hypothetical protein